MVSRLSARLTALRTCKSLKGALVRLRYSITSSLLRNQKRLCCGSRDTLGLKGLFSVTKTVLASGALTVLTTELIHVRSMEEFFVIRLSVKTTSSLVKGCPSDQVTPWRKWNVILCASLASS